MIKGINHQIIEITQTENKYYERALLVLKPEYAAASAELLETEAKNCSVIWTPYPRLNKNHQLQTVLYLHVFTGASAHLSLYLFTHFFNKPHLLHIYF